MEPNWGKRIKTYLKEREATMLNFLDQLVRIETPSRDREAQTPLFKVLSQKVDELGFYHLKRATKKTGGYLYARPSDRIKGPYQLLIGHGDTVWPKGTLKEMPIRIEDGKMKGPGVYDMKAGLTQMLFAIEAIKAMGLPTEVEPVILINSDEEIGSHESTPAIRRLAKRADRAFVLEPPLDLNGKLKTARKGIGRFTITVKGKAAHAGLKPEEGVNAILELSRQIQYLYTLNDPIKGITLNVGMVEGGIAPNVIAPESKAILDVRVFTHEDAAAITSKIYDLQPIQKGISIEVSGGIGRPPMEKDAKNQALWQVAKELGDTLGLSLEQGTAGGDSDGNTTSLYTPTLDGLGTPGDGAYAAHEFIFTEQLIERTALLSLLLLAPPLGASKSAGD